MIELTIAKEEFSRGKTIKDATSIFLLT